MIKKHQYLTIVLVAAFALILGFCSLGLGRYELSIGQSLLNFIHAVVGKTIDKTTYSVLFNIRFPRVILALFAGAGLSVAGAAFQSLFGNPLATPDTLGVATGASLGAVVALLLKFNPFAVQATAVLFGILAVFLVYSISNLRGNRSIVMLVLSGMVISSLCQALISVTKLVADPQNDLPTITFWLMGSLASTTLKNLALGLPFIIVGMVVLFLLRWKMNGVSLSEDEARTLGINIKLVRGLVIMASTMITAAVISLCGQIGWMGLLVPHISRMLFGNNNQYVVPASIGLGSLLFLIIDTTARTITATEIPVSILTAMIGAPFFIILLRKSGGIKI